MFSLFAPLWTLFSIKKAVVVLGTIALCLLVGILLVYLSVVGTSWTDRLVLILFPNNSSFGILLFSLFLSLGLINLFSIIIYRYPLTTTLGFNFRAALSCWIGGVLIQVIKYKFSSSLLPANSPWYLVPFLCLVEFIRILVRPITLCFRLLANITAGHILIALICKIPIVWTIGRLFGVLELMVSLVQAFVFSILIRVYLEEAFSH